MEAASPRMMVMNGKYVKGGLFCGGSDAKRIDHGIMQGRAYGRDLVIFTPWIHAIRQQNYEKLAVWINPDRRAGIA